MIYHYLSLRKKSFFSTNHNQNNKPNTNLSNKIKKNLTRLTLVRISSKFSRKHIFCVFCFEFCEKTHPNTLFLDF